MRILSMDRGRCKCMLFLISSFSLTINILVLANPLLVTFQQSQSLCHDHEKFALLRFKQSFLINCYASHPAFARPKVNSWSDSSSIDHMENGSISRISDCCFWEGVKCNEETGHVIGLDLSSSCLYGTFPSNSSLFGLDYLRELDLSDNNFNYSQIPSAVGLLHELTRLNLSQSTFIGQIPLGISKMSNLSILDLSSNPGLELQYDLSFEKLVRNLPRLTQLHLVGVNISSVVPVILSNLTSLQALSLVHCHLYGTFPTDVLLLPKLTVLSLDNNINLGGFLPEFPSNRPLRILTLTSTAFSGQLTSSIGKLSSLTVLGLVFSGFTGPIPSSVGNLTKLTILGLRCNFNGDLPLPTTNLTQLTGLELSGVHVRPQILNSWLLKLSKLETLSLPKTTLRGEIPPAIANLSRLNSLGLGLNQLTGPLPVWLANKTKLYFLDLEGNHFQGPIIPQWFSQITNLNTLFLSSNGKVAMFEPLLKLPNLSNLELIGVNLVFPPDASTNSSHPKFGLLSLVSCNLTEFPQFLRYQDELQLLNFQGNNIVGAIPQWFVNTTAERLLEISLADNLLTGFEQPQVFLPWNNLKLLYIQGNELQGQLPTPPKSLQIYHISDNQLSGVIPKQLCEASSLVSLDLSSNNLSGRIPTCIGPLLGSSLEMLNFRGNNFRGTISQTFTRACTLQMISLSGNQLEGQLPKSLTNCRVLEVLDVGKNRLNGTFPSWLGSLPKLRFLVLRHNNFQGRIPTLEPGHQFSCLRIIDLSYNFYTGDIPSSFLQNWAAMRNTTEDLLEYSSNSGITITMKDIGVTSNMKINSPYSITISNKGTERLYSKILTVFRVIDFSSNYFSGSIPDVFGSLRGLQALNLSNNKFVGDIPSSLANIIDLESLDLSQNMLSGEIPQRLAKITFLEVFNVSHNRLVGRIPQGNQFDAFDNSSFDDNLALCGGTLSKKCENKDSMQSLPAVTNDDIEEESKLIDWMIISFGCVSGLIAGFIVGKIYITDRYHDWFMETFGRRTRRRPKLRAMR